MSFFDFTIKDITGKPLSFELFKGKKAILVVNVASQWGLTQSNYTALSAIYADCQEKGL